MDDTHPSSPAASVPDAGRVSIEAEVVEICQDAHQRWARVVMTGASVVQLLPAGVADLHLGDRVVLQCAITVECVRPSPDQREVPER